MPSINTDYAWRIVRDARHVTPSTDWRPTAGIVISPGGGWSASRPVGKEAALLFDTLLPVAYGAPDCIVAQIGQSLDGRIATTSGHSRYVTGVASRIHLHRLRALVDAVVVGASTAALDDPQLTVRHVEGDDPVRVVLDPNGRVPFDRRVFTDDGPQTWHAVRDPGNAAPGATPLRLKSNEPAGVLREVLDTLAAHGLRRVLVEGGALTVSRLIDAHRADRLHIVVAPFLIGSGRSALMLAEIDTLEHALRPVCRTFALGEDRLYDLDLRARAQPSQRASDSPNTST